jgi:GntR family transcriptional regulator
MDTLARGNGPGRPFTPLTVTPLYLQVRDILVKRIETGEWSNGRSMPSEGEFAAEFRVSQGTMRCALNQLEGEGILTRRQGRGTFVVDRSWEKREWWGLPDLSDSLRGPRRALRKNGKAA